MLKILEKTHRVPRLGQEEEVRVVDDFNQAHCLGLQGGDAGCAPGHEKEASCININFLSIINNF